MKPLVYLSGPYTGDIKQNILNARAMAIKLWEFGFAVICPHLNTAHFEQDCGATYEDYLEGDLRMVEGCDAVLMLKGWQDSEGAKKERAHAQTKGKPVYTSIHSLMTWWHLKVIKPPADQKDTVLDRAKALVFGDRGSDYGPPQGDFACAAAMYSAYISRKYNIKLDLKAADWPPAMICTKLSRLANKFKMESLDDIAGYVQTWEMVMGD